MSFLLRILRFSSWRPSMAETRSRYIKPTFLLHGIFIVYCIGLYCEIMHVKREEYNNSRYLRTSNDKTANTQKRTSYFLHCQNASKCHVNIDQ